MNPFLDPRGESRRSTVEPHYLRRLARVGAVVFAVLMAGGIVWHAHRQANRALNAPAPVIPAGADEAVPPPVDAVRDDRNPHPPELDPEVRRSLERIPAAVNARGREQRIPLTLPESRIAPPPHAPDLVDPDQLVPGRDPYLSSSKSILLEYTTAEEVFGYSSKSAAIRPFASDADDDAEPDDEGEEEDEDETAATGASPASPAP